MTGAIVLITDVLYGATATAVTGGLALLTFALFWYALPLKRRLSSEEEPDPPTDRSSACLAQLRQLGGEVVDEGQVGSRPAQHLQVAAQTVP